MHMGRPPAIMEATSVPRKPEGCAAQPTPGPIPAPTAQPDAPAFHPEAADPALKEEDVEAMDEDCKVEGASPALLAGRAEARRDVLFELDGMLQVGDVSIVYPGAHTFRQAAARTVGAAADVCDKKHHQGSIGCLSVPLTLEVYGRFFKPLLQLLGDVGAQAA
jgi:hypothetical protein